MYTAPNGMVFNDYWESIKWAKAQLEKEKEAIFAKANFKDTKCPRCGRDAALKENEFYTCWKCGIFSLSTYNGEDEENIEDESEN